MAEYWAGRHVTGPSTQNNMSQDKRQPMLEGAARGSKISVRSQLKAGIHVNEKSNREDDNDRTALHLSAEAGHTEVVAELLRSLADVDARDRDGVEPLHLAAGNNRLQVFQQLLDHGASLEAEDRHGQRAVHFAATCGHMILLEEMKKLGGDLMAVTRDGSTPLHLAAENNQLQVVQWLLKQGVDASSKNYHQETPEDSARRKSHSEVADVLKHHKMSLQKQQDGRDVNNPVASSSVVLPRGTWPMTLPDTHQRSSGSREDSNHTQPSLQPYSQPSLQPYSQPSLQPYSQPLFQPYHEPLFQPLLQEYYQPNTHPLNSPQPYPHSQHLPQASPHSQHLPQASPYSQHLPQASPYSQHLPQASPHSQHFPQTSPHSQHLPQASPHSQHLPQTYPRSQHLPQTSPRSQHLPQTYPRSQHLPQTYPRSQHLPQTSPRSQHLPQTSPHSQHLPQTSPHSQHLPQTYPRSQHLPQTSPHSQHLPQASPHSQHLPQTYPQPSPHPSSSTLHNRESHPSAQLLLAATEGRAEEIGTLVASGADLSLTSTKPGEEGLQAFHLACWGGQTEVVKKLLDLGVDPRAVAAGREGVHWAAFGGHVAVLRVLKDRECDINAAATTDGSTPLHLAADNGNLDATRWLVEHGAQIDARDNHGHTPGDLAIESETPDVYNYLNDRLREEQLVEAAGAGDFEVTLRLIKDKVSVDAPSHNPQIRGRRALHQAADGGHTALVEALLKAGADPTAGDNEGVLGVHLAVQAGHLEVLTLLLPQLPHGTAEVKGEKLVHWASKGGHVKILQYLKTRKCNLRALTKGNRRTALHLAADNGNLEAAKWLVEQGLSLNHKDADGLTAQDLAEYEGHKEVALYLQQVQVPQRAKTTLQESKFLEAAADGRRRTLEELLEAKVNVDCMDQQGRNAIQLACAAGHLQAAQLLVARGAQLHDQDDEGNTAVHLAAEGGHLPILKVLRDNGCDLSSTNNEDDTPLHSAARRNQIHVLKWLLDQGVEANLTNGCGNTAQDVARERKNKEAVRLLSSHIRAAGDRNLRRPERRPEGGRKKVEKHQERSRDRTPSQPQSEGRRQKHPLGLKRFGNTCYMNSVIQCLYNTSFLTSYFLHHSWREDINMKSEYGGEVANAFQDVIYQLDSRGETLASMKSLKRILGEHEVMFKGKEQQDAHDFFSLLLHALDTDLQRSGPSHIGELFTGLHKSDIVCEKTSSIISSVDELFSSLTLTVGSQKSSKHHCTLQELLTQYYTPCSIEWECPACNTIHDCIRTTRIQHLPKILVIHLSRVSKVSRRHPSDRKQIVTFSKHLPSLDAFHSGTLKGEYSLYGVCYHMGTPTSGHYTSVCRDWVLKNVWREFDDEVVTRLERDFPGHEDAHMLFYENLGS